MADQIRYDLLTQQALRSAGRVRRGTIARLNQRPDMPWLTRYATIF
jgi:hypothetical protein